MEDQIRNIKKYLAQEDEILWSYAKRANIMGFHISLIMYSFLSISLIGLSWFGALFKREIIYFISIPFTIVILLVFIWMLLVDYRKDKQKTKTYNLSWQDCKQYQKVFILTKKWWIQKDIELKYSPHFDRQKYSEGICKFEGDILFLNLNCIKNIRIHYKSHSGDLSYILDCDKVNLKYGSIIRFHLHDLTELRTLENLLNKTIKIDNVHILKSIDKISEIECNEGDDKRNLIIIQ